MPAPRMFNYRDGDDLRYWRDVIGPSGHGGWGRVAISVRHWLPYRCPGCGGTGPYYALANWVPVLVDGRGDVVEVDPDSEEIWAVLDESGPGLRCRTCGCDFYPAATMFPPDYGVERSPGARPSS